MDLQIPTSSVERELQMAAPDDHIIVFEHANFRGHSRDIFFNEPDLSHPDDNTLDNKISSFVIIKGSWEFFLNTYFNTPCGVTIAPGAYATLPAGITNDAVSSLRAV